MLNIVSLSFEVKIGLKSFFQLIKEEDVSLLSLDREIIQDAVRELNRK